MSRAIGMVEFKTVSTGVTATDTMVKAAAVELVEAQTVCPGKYIAIITGNLSAVEAAVAAVKTQYQEQLIDSFVLGNPHDGIFPAIYGTTQIEEISSLGILETYDAAAIIVAHNHPSGNLDPSADDEEVTEKLVQAGQLLGIDVLDHLIVAKSGYRSINGR